MFVEIRSSNLSYLATIRRHIFVAILNSSSPRESLDSVIVQTSWTKGGGSKVETAAYFEGLCLTGVAKVGSKNPKCCTRCHSTILK